VSVIDEMNLREKVKLLGWKSQEEILDYLMDSDILLVPSVTSKDGDQEGIPVVLMEAMALGVNVVSNNHSGIPELVQDGVSGFLAPERDVEALAKKLQQCIENRESWPRIRKEANKVVTQNYNINNLNDQLVLIYKELLGIC
jgi:colanic acid/amylovoran biosynthesis glycosyltransferase